MKRAARECPRTVATKALTIRRSAMGRLDGCSQPTSASSSMRGAHEPSILLNWIIDVIAAAICFSVGLSVGFLLVGFSLGDAYKALAEMRKTAPYLPPSPPISPYL